MTGGDSTLAFARTAANGQKVTRGLLGPSMTIRWSRMALILACVCLLTTPPCVARAGAVGDGARARAADTLETLARAEFGNLSAAELALVRGAVTPRIAWASPVRDPDASINNPAKAETWGPERTIRASVITWLLTNSDAAKLIHPSGIGVAAARIAGQIDLEYLTSAFPLTLLDCSVPDGLDLSYAHLRAVDLRRSWTGPIFAEEAIIDGHVGLQYGHYGEVSFFRTEIKGDIDCSGATMIGATPFSAVDATIRGDLEFHDGFSTAGVIDLRLARVKRSVSFHDARFFGPSDNGLNAERAKISGTIYWVDIATTQRTMLDLEDVRAASLWDDEKSWPAPGNLDIKGFVYDDFSGGPTGGIARLRWLRLQPRSLLAQPQPYRQLALVLRAEGENEGAVRVDIARENELTGYADISLPTRLWRLALWATIGYGYRPLRAIWWILAFVLVGAALFRWGYRARLITPTSESAYESFIRTGMPPKYYPPFSSLVYSLENFLPVVDLHQGAFWRPNPHHSHKQSGRIFKWSGENMPAKLLRWYLWLHILAGWTITPLLFAGLTGLLRND
jgi:hypothetical protein